jgi:hypothetical protein
MQMFLSYIILEEKDIILIESIIVSTQYYIHYFF